MNSIFITGSVCSDVQLGDDNSFNFNVLDYNRSYGSNYFRCKLLYSEENKESLEELFKNIYKNNSIVKILGNIYQNKDRKSFIFVHTLYTEDISKDDLISKARVMFDENDIELLLNSKK